MTYCFYIFISFCLIVIQTTAFQFFPLTDNLYDLICPLVVYLGIYRPTRISLPVILLVGFIMDNLSGGPFLLYMTAYVWIFFSVKAVIQFFHVGENILSALIVVSAVLVENMFILASFAISGQGVTAADDSTGMLFKQMIWALATGPFYIILLKEVSQKWDDWLKTRVDEQSG